MLRKFLFILVLLWFCVSPRLFSQSVLVERETLIELQNLNNSLNGKLLNTISSLIQQDLELEKWLGISKQQRLLINSLSADLLEQKKVIEQISKSYEEQLATQEELNKSLKASSMKTNIVVGGVCIVVGVGLGVGLTVAILEAMKQ